MMAVKTLSLLLLSCWTVSARYDSDRVLLRDVSAITLYRNKMTTGRRSSPVYQLNCVGGTAGCRAFVPEVVQCKNVGTDGYDVQWECKTDMDDSYRFGKVEVNCEGYDYPDDAHILRGSCGLEYTIDYTDAGRERKQNSYSHNYGGGNSVWKGDDHSSGSWFIFAIVVFAVVFLICKMSGAASPAERSRDSLRPPPYPGQSNSPPPYGFKPQYTAGSDHTPPPYYEDTTYTGSRPYGSASTGGFWSGLGLGSLGGYLFGSRRNNYGYSYHNTQRRPYGWNDGQSGNTWGWGNNRNSWGSSTMTHRSSSRTGTSRTTSGFGGTSRR